MARIIVVRGNESMRLKGTVIDVTFPDDQVDLVATQARQAVDLASRVYVAQKVSEVRSHTPAPGSNEAVLMGCKCSGPTPGYSKKRYTLDPSCIVHKGKWPGY